MKKIYILDTNVILHDPQAIFSFEENDVIIPMTVIEEIDQQKKRQDSIGKNGRMFSRYVDQLRGDAKLSQGVELPQGGILRTELNHADYPTEQEALDLTKADNRILAVALNLNKKNDLPVIIVSKDINMRIKADALGIEAQEYETDSVKMDELYPGVSEVKVSPELIDQFYSQGQISAEKLEQAAEIDLKANQCINLVDNIGSSQAALGRYDKDKGLVVSFMYNENTDIWGITPRNREQSCAFELLLNDDIKLVTLVGKAGTGKTLLALAAGMQKVVENKEYKKLIVTRPIVPMGNDLGYLPGNMEEKLQPWMQPIFDNMEFLLGGSDKASNTIADLQQMNLIELEAITYIRGRSIPDQYIIVDEAQNLTPHELKTIITRVGKNTKIILTGDPYQIDHPYLDSDSNGLTYVAEKMKSEPLAGHITLTKGERSPLAELAANNL